MVVTVNLMGGLGNQLFQIFTAIAYACATRQQCIFLNVTTLGDGKVVTQRNTYWNSIFAPLRAYLVSSYTEYICKNKLGGQFSHKEVGFYYSAIPTFNTQYLLILHGYFQSPKYFSEYTQTICRMLGLYHLRNTIPEPIPISPQNDMISLHIRMGDYKKLQQYHVLLPVTYYINAIQHILNKINRHGKTEPFTVLCFYEQHPADVADIHKMIAHLKEMFFETDIRIIDVIGDTTTGDTTTATIQKHSDWQQLLFMSKCRHHIIANSSFSWWSAYLSESITPPITTTTTVGFATTTVTQPVICYPSSWFGPKAGHNTRDLFPPHWTCIPVSG
jgi:hypothetical protein